jgi:hypothetical protein
MTTGIHAAATGDRSSGLLVFSVILESMNRRNPAEMPKSHCKVAGDHGSPSALHRPSSRLRLRRPSRGRRRRYARSTSARKAAISRHGLIMSQKRPPGESKGCRRYPLRIACSRIAHPAHAQTKCNAPRDSRTV